MSTGRHALRAVALGALLTMAAACGGGSSGSGDSDDQASSPAPEGPDRPDTPLSVTTAPAPAPAGSLVAQATGEQVQVYATAAEDQPTVALDNPNENGAPLVFLVEQDQGDWLQVLLPVRPNGSTGWIRQADVDVVSDPYRIEIALAAHTLTVYEGDTVVARHPIGVGRASTPTPGGKYYLKELLRPSNPDGAYGAYAYGLSGFSNVLDDFNGGDGVIGIHGTNDPSTVGTDVSHGCIRLTNDAITELVGYLPLGTPVQINP
jgi:lipoprotein-anchoring transpeptidase ErfK/SrfK